MSVITSQRAHSCALAVAIAAAISSMFSTPAIAADKVDTSGLQSASTYDRFIVKYRKGSAERTDVAKAEEALTRAAIDTRGKALGINRLRRLAVGADTVKTSRKLDHVEAESLMRRIAADPNVEYVEVDALMQPLFSPNDTRYTEQWHYFESTGGLNLPLAWNRSNGGGVVVAVLDTGITNHSDLNANIVAGYDFIADPAIAVDGDGRDANPADPGDYIPSGPPGPPPGCGPDPCTHPQADSSWHGTHVAGTIAAVTNNAKGVAGVAFNAKISPVRVLGRGGGYISDIADGIIWASGGNVSGAPANANPAEVINMSLGGPGAACGPTYQAAIDSAVGRGTVIVASAGNNNADAALARPANCNNVIAVAATDRQGNKASYSNFGSLVDVSAPGGETASNPSHPNGVLSTLNAGPIVPAAESYAFYEGTSMAAPHVAGVVALMQSIKVQAPSVVESQLKSSARSLPGACPGGCGAGIVDANAAVAAATPVPDLYAIDKQGASTQTEVHALGGAGGYQSFFVHKATALNETGTNSSWVFDLGDYNRDGVKDLYAIDKQGGSSKTDVHVLNGADNYQTFLAHKVTALGQTGANNGWVFDLGDYNRDGVTDVYAINRQGASGKTEVHVLNGADNYQTFLTHRATALIQTGNDNSWSFDLGDYNHDGVLDLYAIDKQGGSNKTDVHVLNGANNYQTFLAQKVTVLHQTGTNNAWVFDLGDYNRDGVTDVYAINRQGASGKTEVHVLNGADNYQTFLSHIATALNQTGADASWEFMVGNR